MVQNSRVFFGFSSVDTIITGTSDSVQGYFSSELVLELANGMRGRKEWIKDADGERSP